MLFISRAIPSRPAATHQSNLFSESQFSNFPLLPSFTSTIRFSQHYNLPLLLVLTSSVSSILSPTLHSCPTYLHLSDLICSFLVLSIPAIPLGTSHELASHVRLLPLYTCFSVRVFSSHFFIYPVPACHSVLLISSLVYSSLLISTPAPLSRTSLHQRIIQRSCPHLPHCSPPIFAIHVLYILILLQRSFQFRSLNFRSYPVRSIPAIPCPASSLRSYHVPTCHTTSSPSLTYRTAT